MEIIPSSIYKHIKAACAKHSVDEKLFIAIGLHEKGEYAWTDAVIADLDAGVSISPMGLNLAGAGAPPPEWDKQAWANHLTSPEIWADIAAAHIAYLLQYYEGDIKKAVAAYNRGINGTVNNYQTYVAPVMANYEQLQAKGFKVKGNADEDFQQYAPQTGEWRDVAVNLLGVAQAESEAIKRFEQQAQALYEHIKNTPR